jgi:Carboxypeptidase regulatory-like domain
MRSVKTLVFLFSLLVYRYGIAQQTPAPQPQTGTIIGTVEDVKNDIVPGATVVLTGKGVRGQQKATSNQNGLFKFSPVRPGVSYRVTIHANGFVDWTSPAIQLTPAQSFVDLGSIHLTIVIASTTVTAVVNQEQLATQQVQIAEKQRALGFIPAFTAVYVANPVPLPPRLKFRLAYRTATDPVTFLASAFFAGIGQAADTPDYVQGAKGYGQRFGASYANTLTEVFIGGAFLPSVLHQDPRYFYQGTGSTKSRLLHALRTPAVCKGDNGKWQPNYSSIGGYLASGALANAYYPASNRGVGLLFTVAGVGAAGSVANGVLQEFFVHKLLKK